MAGVLARLLRYVVTGGIAAVVDAGGFAILLQAGLPIPVAGTISFCLAAVVNYLLTSRFVFRRASHARGFAIFLAMASLGLLVNVGVTWSAAKALPIAPILAKVMGIAAAFLLNFFLNLFVVFAPRVHSDPLPAKPSAD